MGTVNICPMCMLDAWTEHPQRYWFRRCDVSKRRLLFGWLYECYPPVGSGVGWWFACPNCLYHTDAWCMGLGRELTDAEKVRGSRVETC